MRYDSILQTIGRTPVIRVARIAPDPAQLFVKLEARNPMGSVKDRPALSMIEAAERDGRLRPGQTVIEASSGNTGISLAMICARKGYPLVIVMAENFSVERRRLMRFLGAQVVLTPAALKGSGMRAKARELALTHGWFLPDQFSNEANAEAHLRSTGPEILADFSDRPLDYLVLGCGTGGTLKGVATFLRRASPRTRIVVCEPDNAPMLSSGLPQARDADGEPLGSHPTFRPHVMQGWSPDFLPLLTQSALQAQYADEILAVGGIETFECARRLAREEGIFTGITGGATLAGALQLLKRIPSGASVLAMLPDTGERYLSTPLFESVSADMNEQELGIAASSPGYRFGQPAPAPAATPAPAVRAVPSPAPVAASAPAETLDAAAVAHVAQVIGAASEPVVLFALEWCEFCWSLRRMFAHHRIAYRSVDLDSAALQKDEWGAKLRAALSARTGVATIPQVFVGGEFIGGCTDTLDACRSGDLQRRLKLVGIERELGGGPDPHSFLPGWLHRG
jgi:cysteine synthase A